MPCRSRKACEGRQRRRLLALLAGLPLGLLAAGCAGESGSPLTGRPFPALDLVDLKGRPQSTAVLAGRPLLINVWATWCRPCRSEMADLDQLYGALRGRGLALIGIAVDEDVNLVREYLLRAAPAFPVWHDRGGGRLAAILGTPAIPATVLVGRDGRVRRLELGPRAWAAGVARTWVEALLA